MVKVSIGMPVFNKGKYLKQAIDAVFAQTFQDFELIIIDDCSTDNSAEIIRSYNDPRIRFYSHSRNMGLSEALNSCIEKANGEYVTIAHADDIWTPIFLEAHITLMDKFPDINISHSLAHMIDEEGNITKKESIRTSREFEIIDSQKALRRLVKGCNIITPTIFLRKGKFPYYDRNYSFCPDWNMYLNMAADGNDFLFINVPLIYYRYNDGNVTSMTKKDGTAIFEEYKVLTHFYNKNEYTEIQKMKAASFYKLSKQSLRLSRDFKDRKTIFLYHKLSLFIFPLNIINPVFWLYFLTALIWGSEGMRILKKISKSITNVVKPSIKMLIGDLTERRATLD